MYNIDAEIIRIKNALNNIFCVYEDNSYFENIEPTAIKAIIYGKTIKFIPIELNDEVQELLNILADLEEEKHNNKKHNR